jgi:hypothetical protein
MKTKDQKTEKSRDERLEELAEALKEAQMMLLKQSELLEQCAGRYEEPEHSLVEARQELALVTAERDKLQKQLLSLEKMQTETVALPEGHQIISDSQDKLPSIQELMADLYSSTEDSDEHEAPRHRLNGPSADAPDADLGEMIAPEIIAPEVFDGDNEEGADREISQVDRLLVYMDSDRPVKVPLIDGTTTIGRSESAHIHIEGPYISRIHARIVCRPGQALILDAGSTNGIKVNAIDVKRQELKHGDVITLGSQRFTFVDLSQES